MAWRDLGIEYGHVPEALAATARTTLRSRLELPAMLSEMAERIPSEDLAGPPFCVIRFVTSVTEGLDAEVGFPVSRPIDAEGITTSVQPRLEVLSLVHTGSLDALGETYKTLYGAAAKQGLISDEFAREVYPDWERSRWDSVELQFVIHDWNELFTANVNRVLGEETGRRVLAGWEELDAASTLDERFQWVKAMVERLDDQAREDQTYDILSRCAHVFPREQIDKLQMVYEDALGESADPLEAVDAVIAFMGDDPGWGTAPTRKGNVVYATKAPRDARAYDAAQSDRERRRAYCFCPIVRDRLGCGMPPAFCTCGAGWYRQQWEGAIGSAVSITIVTSILKGDDARTFAIRLPDGLQGP